MRSLDFVLRTALEMTIVFIFAIFSFTFYIQPVNAQSCPVSDPSGAVVCPGTTRWCGGTCQTPPATCAGEYVVNCGSCACACPSGQTDCGGSVCEASDGTCAAANRSTSSVCTAPDTCGGCSSGFSDCEIGAGFDCRSTASAACAAPRSYDPCTGACTDPYVLVSPAAPQTGFFNVTGNGTIGGDLFLGTGRAIRVDNTGASSRLNFGNYTGTEFHLALHAEGTGLSELLLQQGSADRWALSVRPGDTTTPSGGDFEIRRGTTGWPRALAVDYNTGNITFDSQIQLANLSTASQPAVAASLTGALYYNTTANEIRVYNGTTWAAVGGSGGLATSGTATSGTLPRFTGAAGVLTLTNSLLSETGSTLTVSGAITATGCFGPTYQRLSIATSQGSVVSGTLSGYEAANDLCDDAETGSHVCTTDELLMSISCGVAALPVTGFAWINNGPPGFTATSNDCQGWTTTSPTAFGAYWAFDGNGGQGWVQPCDGTARAFACCR